MLVDVLASENVKNEILDLELESFDVNDKGVEDATEKLTNILQKISSNACKIISKPIKNKKKRYRQVWSDEVIYETKREINALGRKIKHNPNKNNLKQNYFNLCKQLKKMVKQKKYEYKQKIYNMLSDKINKDPKEYWKILKSLKVTEEEEDIPEILREEEKIIKHFQNQGNPTSFNLDFKNKIENLLESVEKMIEYKEETDKPITFAEIKKVISQLKIGKSAGPDRILNEVIKCSFPVMGKSFLKIFNLILKSGKYPHSWKKSFIIALHKSGSKGDPNNYRGISLINSLPKIFNAILNNRLTKFIDCNLSNNQFGFRENHRTSDSIFILKSLINKYIHKEKKKLYICFVDLRKAFDSVWRIGLLYKLTKMGVGKLFFNIIKNQYENTESAIKYKDQFSNYFNILRGVKQGDSLSPTLFNIFINDLVRELDRNKSDPLTLISTNISCLLFADDLLIMSESKEGLQNSLNSLSTFCDNWQLSLNVTKTNTMIIRQNSSKDIASIVSFKNIPITCTTEYKFLGMWLKNNGNLSHSTADLSKKARKVLFALKTYTKSINDLPINVACNLFDTLVKPIALYNSEITYLDTYISYLRAKKRASISGKQLEPFSFIDKSPIEKLHLQFCKHILGVKKNASNLAVRAELGRYPLELYIRLQSMIYLIRLYSEEINPLLKESFILTQKLDSTGIFSWFTYVKDVLTETGIDLETIKKYSLKKVTKSNREHIRLELKHFYDKLIDKKFSEIESNSKLNIYKNIKLNLKSEFYLSCQKFENRKLITKFRISDHNLQIEKGRYIKIPREERLCQKCSRIEDECHFFLYCEKNSTLRKPFFDHLINENDSFLNLSETDKLKFILNPTSLNLVNKLGSFLKQSIELRTGDS